MLKGVGERIEPGPRVGPVCRIESRYTGDGHKGPTNL